MTVIAVKDGIIAADTQAWNGNLKLGQASKLCRFEFGVCGFSGWKPAIERAKKWLKHGEKIWLEDGVQRLGARPSPADEGDLSAVILTRDGIWNLSHKFEVYRSSNAIETCGAHSEFLYGAMLAGASAEEAVRLAIRYCEFAGGEVEAMQL